jgi:hypothetical protein
MELPMGLRRRITIGGKEWFFLLLVVFAASSILAGPGIVRDSRGVGLDNDLPVLIVAQVVDRDQAGQFVASDTVAIPAKSYQKLRGTPAGHTLSIETLEVVHQGIPLRTLPKNCGVPAVNAVDIDAVKSQLKQLEFSDTASASERLKAAADLARLDYERKTDEKETLRNDPLKNYIEMRRDLADIGNMDVNANLQKYLNKSMQQANDAASDLADLAIAWASVDWEKQSILRDEASALKDALKEAKVMEEVHQQVLTRATVQFNGGELFLKTTTKLLSQTALPKMASERVGVQSPVSRICSGPSALEDFISVTATAPAELTTLIAKVQFDKGPQQDTFFRRVNSSNTWVARIYWPTPAKSLRVQLQSPVTRDWMALGGVVETKRVSYQEAAITSKKAVSVIQKKLNEANFRAGGGDNIRTIPIP